MVRSLFEEILFWAISLTINLIIFSLLTVIFTVEIKETPEIYPLKVVVKEVKFEKPKPKKQKSVVKAKAEARRTEAVHKKALEIGKKRKVGATVTQAHEKGDVKVPVEEEEDVSILAELRKRVESRIIAEKQKKEAVKKEVGTLSAVVKEGKIRIRGGTRKIIRTPPLPEIVTREFPGKVRVRIWVSPSGEVVKAILLQRSGDVNIDSLILSFVRGIRFEKVPDEDIQVGEIVFNFRGG